MAKPLFKAEFGKKLIIESIIYLSACNPPMVDAKLADLSFITLYLLPPLV